MHGKASVCAAQQGFIYLPKLGESLQCRQGVRCVPGLRIGMGGGQGSVWGIVQQPLNLEDHLQAGSMVAGLSSGVRLLTQVGQLLHCGGRGAGGDVEEEQRGEQEADHEKQLYGWPAGEANVHAGPGIGFARVYWLVTGQAQWAPTEEISCMALTITGLSKTYPNGVQALKNISLNIGNNMFGLLGPNGAGKSTLMRTIATLQEPDSGTIFLDGIDVLKEKNTIRQMLGYLPQEFGVYPKISASDMLSHLAVMKGITNKGERKESVDALLHQTNLWDFRKKALSTYSGGMKQRFGIAQALLGKPRLIIVDEPTAGLDPGERNRFLNLLSSIGRDITVILSTHIVEDVRELCARMAIIASGEMLLEGAPEETLELLQGKMWSKIVGSDDELRSLETELRVLSSHLISGQREIRVYSDGFPGDGFRAVDAGLEDVYFLNLSHPAAQQPVH